MAKLPRKTQKIFCSKPTSENQTSVFGTMKTADKQYSTDVGTLQSNAAYEQGWKSATIASYKPFMEDFNTLNYINTSQLAYLFQQGIPEWDEATAYYKNSFCSYNGDLWKSLIDDNLNNTPSEGEAWTLFTSGKKSGSGLEICDIGMALYVDETQGKRRYLNGQIVDINTNTQAWLNRLLQIQATNPEYFTDEATWQSEATLNVDGCVYKFVLNYDSTGTNVISVRLPKYPDYVEVSAGSSITTAPVTGFVRGSQNSGIVNLPSSALSSSWDGKYSLNSNGKYNGFTLFAQDGSGNVSVRDDFTGSQWKVDAQADLSNLKLKNTKVKLYYFIQIATGSETKNNIINEIELNNPYSLFDSKYSDHELNNLSWLKSEGQWNAKAVYTDAYDKLLKVHNGTETVAGLSVKLSTETYTDYDFVLNTAEETFRLPLKNHTADDGNSVLTLYFYVGETVQNANLIDAGRISEVIPNKLDKKQLYNKITNCLLEVPQKIKLELNNGVLTLKAGSQVIVPNGFEADGTTPKFDEVEIESDVVAPSKAWSTSKDMIAYGLDKSVSRRSLTLCYSGTTRPSDEWCFWYDTANNKCWNIRPDGDILISLPVSIVNANSSQVYTSINQVFNGMGYIDSTVWVDKGVKGLIPNGRNEDGTLRNIEHTTTSVLLNSVMHMWDGQFTLNILLYQDGIDVQDVDRFSKNKETPVSTSQYVYSYDEEDNYWYYSTDNGVNWVIQRFITIGSLTEVASNKSVSNFQPKQAFRTVDYNEALLKDTPHITETYKNGTSWYRVWSDGWCEQGGIVSASTSGLNANTVTLLKAYRDTYYSVLGTKGDTDGAAVGLNCPTVKTTETFTWSVAYPSSLTRAITWRACGYIA